MCYYHYRPQRKVMLSEACVIPSSGGGRQIPLEGDPLWRKSPLDRDLLGQRPPDRDPWTQTLRTEPPGQRPPNRVPQTETPWTQTPLPLVLTSSGGHCSSRCAFYWNGLLFCVDLKKTRSPILCLVIATLLATHLNLLLKYVPYQIKSNYVK